MRQQQHARKNHRAERINMFEGVETDAAELPGSVVAKLVCHEGMRSLVEGNGDQERENPDRDGVQRNIHVISLS